MPQRSPIFHRQPQYATNIISDMHIEISPSEEAYREDIDMCSRCDIFVLTLIAHISFYLTDTLAYCVNISTYCVYRLSSVPFSAYRFSDLGAYHITRFIRITQILEMYCSISKIYRTCCRVLQTYRILGEKQPWNWGKTACHPSNSNGDGLQSAATVQNLRIARCEGVKSAIVLRPAVLFECTFARRRR